jgi:hypothetical protein
MPEGQQADARIVYLHSERFVADMVKALQLNAIADFKRYYRSVDALLIDDIQFFAKKDRSQEEFFHTFNALLEGGQQMILTCDRYPKEIEGLEERLKSRFRLGLDGGSGATGPRNPGGDPHEQGKSGRSGSAAGCCLLYRPAHSLQCRELEGALKRVIASANFTRREIDVDLVKESLKDLLALQDKQVSLDNIQRTVAEYYKIKVADLNSADVTAQWPTTAGRHGAGQGTDQLQPAGNRRQFRWSRSHHRAACLSQDQGAARDQLGHPRRLQEPAAPADDLKPGANLPHSCFRAKRRRIAAFLTLVFAI